MATIHKRKSLKTISTYELEHSKNLSRIYELFSLLKDYYHYYLKKNLAENKIGSILSTKFSGDVYTNNRQFIKDALVNIKTLYKMKVVENASDIKLQKIILGTIKEHIQYIQRILDLFEDIICRKDLTKLKEEIAIFEKESKIN